MANFWSRSLVFLIKKILEICIFFSLDTSKHSQFRKFQELSIWKILKLSIRKVTKICDLENQKNRQLGKSPQTSYQENFRNCQFSKFRKFAIWKIQKICNQEISKNFQFGKFQKYLTQRVPKIYNLENFNNCQFGKFRKFLICKIQKLSVWKVQKIFNS